MIRYFGISNFKSLVNFSVAPPKFTVLIGMNGAGKTTILQAFDFLSHMMDGEVDAWLNARNWSISDLGSKLISATNIHLSASYGATDPSGFWSGAFNRKERACLMESVSLWDGAKFSIEHFRVRDRQYRIANHPAVPITFTYQGSLLSQLRDSELTPELKEVRDEFRQIRSLELLSPHLMRQRTRETAKDVGVGGERLSAFLHGIKGAQKTDLMNLMREFYPRIVDFKSSPTKGGWKKLSIIEEYEGRQIESEVRHINDGLLRILAVLAQTMTERSMLLFDEVENGVNPEIAEQLVNLLVNARQQVVVTTHSPMILNYLDDAVARQSVMFVYKTPEGFTRLRPFFSIPGIGEKLSLMGPGEAFVDTDLVSLTARCVEIDKQEEALRNGTKEDKIRVVV